jgi:hypothetical protein
MSNTKDDRESENLNTSSPPNSIHEYKMEEFIEFGL